MSKVDDEIRELSKKGWQVVPATQIVLPVDDRQTAWVGIVMEKMVTKESSHERLCEENYDGKGGEQCK